MLPKWGLLHKLFFFDGLPLTSWTWWLNILAHSISDLKNLDEYYKKKKQKQKNLKHKNKTEQIRKRKDAT